MNLVRGFRFAVAPRFHDRATWADRLALNGGIESNGGAFFPRPEWRTPSVEELRLLVAAAAAGTDTCLAGDVAGLILVPSHVRRAWWTAAEQAESLDGEIPGYERFVTQLVDFLTFKRLPLPEQCSFDVVASRPEQSSTRVNPETSHLAGLTHSAGGMPPFARGTRTLASINLGDEATHLVLCNLPPEALRTLPGEGSAAAATGTLASAFLTACPDYPLVRVRLDPGDGLWLPQAGVIHDGWTHGKEEADVVLTISVNELHR